MTEVGARNGLRNRCEGETALDRELGAIEDSLGAMGLHMQVFLEDGEEGVSYDSIAPYPVVVYHNLGWSNAGHLDTVATLEAAADAGKGLIVMGDDAGYLAHNYDRDEEPGLMDLTAIRRYRHNGHRGQSIEVEAFDHPVIDGAWGQLAAGWQYVADVDRVELKNRGEEPLMYITGTDYPAVWAEETDTQRSLTMLMGLYTSHDCPLTDEDGLDGLDILFQNAVWWAGRY